jgi:hypothetical protein
VHSAEGTVNGMLTSLFFELIVSKENVSNVKMGSDIL